MSTEAGAANRRRTNGVPGGPLYLCLKRSIEEAVRAGVFGSGNAPPSGRDLAMAADVSRVTVRKAVQHLVADGLLIQRPCTVNRTVSQVGLGIQQKAIAS